MQKNENDKHQISLHSLDERPVTKVANGGGNAHPPGEVSAIGDPSHEFLLNM